MVTAPIKLAQGEPHVPGSPRGIRYERMDGENTNLDPLSGDKFLFPNQNWQEITPKD